MTLESREQRFLRLLRGFSDGSLSAEERIEFARHVSTHPDALPQIVANERFREDVRNALELITPAISPTTRVKLAELAAAAATKEF